MKGVMSEFVSATEHYYIVNRKEIGIPGSSVCLNLLCAKYVYMYVLLEMERCYIIILIVCNRGSSATHTSALPPHTVSFCFFISLPYASGEQSGLLQSLKKNAMLSIYRYISELRKFIINLV